MSDRVLRHFDYSEALRYVSFVASRLRTLFRELQPSLVIGSFDGVHSGISLAVARRLGTPWFAMSFTTIPQGLTGFCTGLTPDRMVRCHEWNEESLRRLAEKSLQDYEAQNVVVPASVSANSLGMIARRLPGHVTEFSGNVLRALARSLDRYMEPSPARMIREYLRKRSNLALLPKGWFCEDPPRHPFAFFGFHMQPESSIDVWAPFYSNQVAVIETLARAMPASHELLVKLHRSDADNYSRKQLARLRALPGVRLVSPFVSSRQFLEQAALVFAIQGTMALEAGLLGRQVLMFGASPFSALPSVTRVGPIHELPGLISQKLTDLTPSRDAILSGYTQYLSMFAPGCYNDWRRRLNEAERKNMANLFFALVRHCQRNEIAQ